MAALPTPGPNDQPPTPEAARFLAALRLMQQKADPAPVGGGLPAATQSYLDQSVANVGPATQQNPTQPIPTPATGMAQPVAAPAAPESPTVAPPTGPTPVKSGPIKSLLSSLLYGAGQSLVHRAGLPTDLEKQTIAQNQARLQQGANDTSAYRQAQTSGLEAKAAQYDAERELIQAPTDQRLGVLSGQMVPRGVLNAVSSKLANTALQNQGKANVAQINIGAGTIPLSKELADRAGVPEMAGTPVSGKFLTSVHNMLGGEASGITAGDIGNGHTGLLDKTTGKVLQDFGTSQRIIGAGINAQNRTVQVVNPNDPTSTVQMSPAQANATGAQGTQSIGYQTQKSVLKDFTSGKDAGTLNAINTTRGHTVQGIAAVDALGNGDLPALNKIAQFYHVQTGSSAPLVFNSIKNALEGEISKSLTGAGATVSEIAKVGQDFNNASSPQQLKDVFSSYGHLLDTKKASLQQQFQQGMQARPNFNPTGAAPTPDSSDPYAKFKRK